MIEQQRCVKRKKRKESYLEEYSEETHFRFYSFPIEDKSAKYSTNDLLSVTENTAETVEQLCFLRSSLPRDNISYFLRNFAIN